MSLPAPITDLPDGWYPTPDGRHERYWDGDTWSVPRLAGFVEGADLTDEGCEAEAATDIAALLDPPRRRRFRREGVLGRHRGGSRPRTSPPPNPDTSASPSRLRAGSPCDESCDGPRQPVTMPVWLLASAGVWVVSALFVLTEAPAQALLPVGLRGRVTPEMVWGQSVVLMVLLGLLDVRLVRRAGQPGSWLLALVPPLLVLVRARQSRSWFLACYALLASTLFAVWYLPLDAVAPAAEALLGLLDRVG